MQKSTLKPSGGYRPTWRALWLLLLILFPLFGCVTPQAVPVPCPKPDPLPDQFRNFSPPPQGTFRQCLTELEQGQTSGPACATLRQLPKPSATTTGR